MSDDLDQMTPYGFTWRQAITALQEVAHMGKLAKSLGSYSKWVQYPCSYPSCPADTGAYHRKFCTRHIELQKRLFERKRATAENLIDQLLSEGDPSLNTVIDGLRRKYKIPRPNVVNRNLTVKVRFDAMTRFESRSLFGCVYCSGPFEHIDHVWPIALGGSNEEDNLVPSCARCNIRKGGKDPWLWMSTVFPGQDHYTLLDSWGIAWEKWASFE